MSRTARLLAALVVAAFALSSTGCLPGQFPIPPDRSSPPKASKKAAHGASGYFHGGMSPLPAPDAAPD